MKLKKTIVILAFAAALFCMDATTATAAPRAEPQTDTAAAHQNSLEDIPSLRAKPPFSLSTALKLSRKNNKLSVAWTVTSTCKAAELGIRSLKLQQYSNGVWKTVKTGSCLAKNQMVFTSGYSYKHAVHGSKYRAVGTAYAIVDGWEKIRAVQTSEFIY
ncbi:hypothetical protein V1226_22400 [Lachnospiraceae bacterium JLR.KK009]|nr:hypothetical protein C810_03908 [Lachnospiraceae bacterium A2]